jgi:voltage-gated potassium channel
MVARLGRLRRVQILEATVLVLVFVVLALLLYEMLHPMLSAEARRRILLIDTACCVVFLTEFALRHRCAQSKRWFWRTYWIDFVTSIPMPDALLLRTGRMFRVARITRAARAARAARLLRLIRAARLVLFFWRGMDKLYDVLNVRLMKRSLLLGVIILLIGAAIIFVAEGMNGDQNAVDTPPEALWWSFTTVVTGGFGDIHNPSSAAGQLTTVVLVLAGMTVVGVFTATLTALLVGDESEEIEVLQQSLGEQLAALDERVERLSETVERLVEQAQAD